MPKPVIWKAAVAGMAGGLAASWAMGQTHALVLRLLGGPGSPQSEGEDATVKAARALSEPVLQRKLTPGEAKAAGPIVDRAFASTIAAAYGVAAELEPLVTRGAGLPFGTAVWLGAHVIVTPALGLSKPVTQSSWPTEAAELTAHFVYGGVTELVRHSMRQVLGK